MLINSSDQSLRCFPYVKIRTVFASNLINHQRLDTKGSLVFKSKYIVNASMWLKHESEIYIRVVLIY